MGHDSEFREQVQQLGKLIIEFNNLPEGPARVAGKELVQLLMDIHGAGLERIMEIVFESRNAGQTVIDELGRDPVTGSLLLLYSLHPDDLETRARKAIEGMRPRLRKLASTAELESVSEGVVRVNLTTNGHSCGSSAKDLRAIVEDRIYEFAPDVVSLEISGLEEPSAAGFVSLDSLLGHAFAPVGAIGQSLRTEAGD